MVGATCAYCLSFNPCVDQIVLVDIDSERSKSESLDIAQSTISYTPKKITSGNYSQTDDSDIIVICAGISQNFKQTRLDLLNTNIKIAKQILSEIQKYSLDPFLIVTSNPVDILTYTAHQNCKFNPRKILGTGTLLDTARFKYFLGKHLQISPTEIEAYVLGEHGNSQIPIFSKVKIKGVDLADYCQIRGLTLNDHQKSTIQEQTTRGAYDIIRGKGSTYYGIASCVGKIVEIITSKQDSILPLSVRLDGEYGFKDMCIGVPCMLGSQGIKKIFSFKLSHEEQIAFEKSAKIIQNITTK